MATINYRMQQKRDTEADWTSENPTLLAGEIGVESDTGKFKIGDGSTAWNDLDYAGGGAGATETYIAAEAITAGEVLAIDASGEAQVADISSALKRDVIGVATETVLATEEVDVKKIGHVAEFAGLTIGEVYFLDTAGGIDTADNITAGYPLIRVGMAVAADTIDVSLETESDDIVDEPIGKIFPFAGTTPPAGSLLCDGAAISRSIYSDLFDAIGETWGVGDGSTTFNVPDFRGAFLRGAGSHGSETMADGNPYAGPAVGAFEDDQFQGHRHDLSYVSLVANNDTGSNWTGIRDSSPVGETDQIVKDPTDGDNGTVRTGDETRGFAAGVIWCIKAARTLSLPDPVTIGSFRFDSGWSSAATDFSDATITINHNLGTPLAELIVKVFVKRDASSVPSTEVQNITAESTVLAASSEWGVQVSETDSDNIVLQTGTNGVLVLDNTGGVVGLADGEYRVLIYKPELISPTYEQSLASYVYDTGWISNSDWDINSVEIPHNFGVSLDNLIVRVFLSPDGTDVRDITTAHAQRDGSGTTDYYGIHLYSKSGDELNTAIMEFMKNGVFVSAKAGGNPTALGGASPYYYRVKIYKPEIMADIIPTTLTTWKFSTGWGANSDWTDMTLDIVHGLDAPITDLIVKFFVSGTADDNSAIELIDHTRTDGSGTSPNAGYQFQGVDDNTIRLQTGADGLIYFNSAGTMNLLDTESWYYKLVIYKSELRQVVDTSPLHTYDISAANQSITLDPTTPLYDDVVIRWSGGDGTYDLDIDPSAGFTIDGETAGVWKGEGEGRLVVIRVSSSEWVVKDYFDSGDFTNGLFRKTADGQITMSHQIASIDVSTASGQVFRSNATTWTFPVTVAAIESCHFQGWVDAIWGGADTAPGTTSVDFRLYAQVSRTGRTASCTARGTWK